MIGDVMINFDKLNGAIVSRETLSRIYNDNEVEEAYLSGQTVWLNKHKIILKNGKEYCVYTRGGIVYGGK